jgi:hypothetical protein
MRKPLPADHVSLEGGHAELECFDCHDKTPVKPRTCTNCHGTNHGGLTNCQDCHDPATGWEPKEGWSHGAFFNITGQHKKLDCTDCHKNGRFANTPRVCVGCHGKKHGGLTNCAACHTTSGFDPSTFRHSSVFVLTGRHAKLACTNCHAGNQFARVLGNGSHQCVSCHGVQHGGLRDCANCHTTAGFESATFRHQTVFPLIGQHATLACSQCHIGGQFLPPPSKVCANCHGPMHGGITGCDRCHTPVSFTDVPPFTAHPIPLGGTHADTTKCTRCHPTTGPGSGPVFNNTVPPCITCHAATIPHVGPTDCERCHWPTTWTDTHFTHSPIYFFPGVEAPHAYNDPIFGPYPVGCAKCHPSSVAVADFTDHSCSNSECH